MFNRNTKSGELVVIQESVETQASPAAGLAPIEKLIHVALPVRLIHMRNGERGPLEMVCTYDVHPRGARLRSSYAVSVGDFITIERAKRRSLCQVIWAASPDSELRGQFTVECVEGSKVPWEEELSQMEEQYLPLNPGAVWAKRREASRFGAENRRRRPRYTVAGGADLSTNGATSATAASLEEIAEFGCLVSSEHLLTPGTGLRLVLNLCDLSVALRGQVRYAIAEKRAMGVEFDSIRQGDRPLLDYVLARLKKPREVRPPIQDFADLEVVTELMEAAAG